MKTRTNQPVFLDNGEKVDDSKLGGTKLYNHNLNVQGENDYNINLILITTNKTPISSTDVYSSQSDNLICVKSYYDNSTELTAVITYFGLSDEEINIYGIDEEGSQLVITQKGITLLTDTVTPL